MNGGVQRDARAATARETLAILERGDYVSASGVAVDLRARQAAAVAGTRAYRPENLPRLDAPAPGRAAAQIAVTRETTLAAMGRLNAAPGGRMGCLNFASARNPGGGFLGGAQAQEESLARASGLYPCLLTQTAVYEENRAHRSLLYLDRIIHSPGVPFFRDDAGALLAAPFLADVLTCAAPNAGAILTNSPMERPLVAPALARRAEQVLRTAAAHGVERLVLGAWGCGVFGNDPAVVARTFAALVGPRGDYHRRFAEVVFAVFDPSPGAAAHRAFAEAFPGK